MDSPFRYCVVVWGNGEAGDNAKNSYEIELYEHSGKIVAYESAGVVYNFIGPLPDALEYIKGRILEDHKEL